MCAYGGDRSCVTEWPPKENLHPQSRFYLLRTAWLEVDVLIRSQDARLLSSASGSLYHATLPRHVGRTQPVKRRQSLSRRRRGGRCCGALHHTWVRIHRAHQLGGLCLRFRVGISPQASPPSPGILAFFSRQLRILLIGGSWKLRLSCLGGSKRPRLPPESSRGTFCNSLRLRTFLASRGCSLQTSRNGCSEVGTRYPPRGQYSNHTKVK